VKALTESATLSHSLNDTVADVLLSEAVADVLLSDAVADVLLSDRCCG
jgi:hypothetical protein